MTGCCDGDGSRDREGQLLDDFTGAAGRGELLVEYQPELSLAAGDWVGVEALVRWDHPRLGRIGPGRFVPLLEQAGCTAELGTWVLGQAIAQMRAWAEQLGGAGPSFVSVNLSAVDLADPALAGRMVDALEDGGISPGQLLAEVTETSLMRERLGSLACLDVLQAYGVRLAIDDFGAGYSALAYLFQLPSDVIKLDRAFLVGCGSPAQLTVIGAVVDLAHKLGLAVVAEGVETDEQLAVVRDAGCDLAQGFRLARPMGADAVADLFAATPAG